MVMSILCEFCEIVEWPKLYLKQVGFYGNESAVSISHRSSDGFEVIAGSFDKSGYNWVNKYVRVDFQNNSKWGFIILNLLYQFHKDEPFWSSGQ